MFPISPQACLKLKVKMDKFPRWRCLSWIVAYADLVLVFILMSFAIMLGINLSAIAQENDMTSQQLSNIPQGKPCSDSNFYNDWLLKIKKTDGIFASVFSGSIYILLLVCVDIFLVHQSMLLFKATNKCTIPETAIDCAWVWITDNLMLLGFCVLFSVVLLSSASHCLSISLVVIVALFILVRTLFLYFVFQFAEELDADIAPEPKELEAVKVEKN